MSTPANRLRRHRLHAYGLFMNARAALADLVRRRVRRLCLHVVLVAIEVQIAARRIQRTAERLERKVRPQ